MRREKAGRTADAVAGVALVACLVVAGWRAADGELSVVAPLMYLAVVTGELWRIDVAESRLPNALVLPGLGFAIAGVAWAVLAGRDSWAAVGWGVGYGAVLLVPALVGAAGMGDVKLAAVLGLVLGSIGVGPALVGSVAPFVAAGAAALAVAAWTGERLDERFAFGPFMLGGFWGAVALAPVL